MRGLHFFDFVAHFTIDSFWGTELITIHHLLKPFVDFRNNRGPSHKAHEVATMEFICKPIGTGVAGSNPTEASYTIFCLNLMLFISLKDSWAQVFSKNQKMILVNSDQYPKCYLWSIKNM